MSDMPHTCQQLERIATMENNIKTIFKRMDEQLTITKAVYELTAEIKVTNERIENLTKAQNIIKDDLEELKATPRNRWNALIGVIISAIGSGIIVFLLTRLGMS